MSVVLLKNYLFHKLGTGLEFKLPRKILHFEETFYCFVFYSLFNLPIIGLTLALEWMISAVIRNWKSLLCFFMVGLLSTRIYDLVLLDVCHFHHTFLSNHWDSSVFSPLSRYSCLYLGYLHPRICLYNNLYNWNLHCMKCWILVLAVHKVKVCFDTEINLISKIKFSFIYFHYQGFLAFYIGPFRSFYVLLGPLRSF